MILVAAPGRNGKSDNTALKRMMVISVLVFFLAGIFSWARYYLDQQSSSLKSICNFSTGSDLVITATGRVSGHIRSSGRNISFSMKAISISIKDISSGIEKNVYIEDELPVSLNTDSPDLLQRDDFITLKCQVVGKQDCYYLYGYETGMEIISRRGLLNRLFWLRSRAYNCLRIIFYNSLEYGKASICEAAVLGNTGNIPAGIATDFKKSGLYHLLAISGLHISFFILIISTFLNLISSKAININDSSIWAGTGSAFDRSREVLQRGDRNIHRKWSKISGILLIISILCFYNFLVGEKASTMRSTLMAVYLLAGAVSGREIQRKTVLSYVFILLLLFNPGFFVEPGFWMTFVAVFAIAYANIPLLGLAAMAGEKIFAHRRLSVSREPGSSTCPEMNYFTSILVTTFSVNIFILPVLIFLFREATLLALLTNIFAIPVFYMLLFVLMIASLSGLFWPPLGEIILKPSGILVELLLRIAKIWQILGFGQIKPGNFDVLHLVIYYVFLLSMLIIISKVIEKTRPGIRHE